MLSVTRVVGDDRQLILPQSYFFGVDGPLRHRSLDRAHLWSRQNIRSTETRSGLVWFSNVGLVEAETQRQRQAPLTDNRSSNLNSNKTLESLQLPSRSILFKPRATPSAPGSWICLKLTHRRHSCLLSAAHSLRFKPTTSISSRCLLLLVPPPPPNPLPSICPSPLPLIPRPPLVWWWFAGLGRLERIILFLLLVTRCFAFTVRQVQNPWWSGITFALRLWWRGGGGRTSGRFRHLDAHEGG